MKTTPRQRPPDQPAGESSADHLRYFAEHRETIRAIATEGYLALGRGIVLVDLADHFGGGTDIFVYLDADSLAEKLPSGVHMWDLRQACRSYDVAAEWVAAVTTTNPRRPVHVYRIRHNSLGGKES